MRCYVWGWGGGYIMSHVGSIWDIAFHQYGTGGKSTPAKCWTAYVCQGVHALTVALPVVFTSCYDVAL